jgi:predicted nucleic acid-binding protein
MIGSKIVLDTNALSYFLSVNVEIREIITGSELLVSVITEMEILSYSGFSSAERKNIRHFLNQCNIIELTQPIRELAIKIRLAHRRKLPDAIIAATAMYFEIPLITTDKDFTKIKDLDLILVSI